MNDKVPEAFMRNSSIQDIRCVERQAASLAIAGSILVSEELRRDRDVYSGSRWPCIKKPPNFGLECTLKPRSPAHAFVRSTSDGSIRASRVVSSTMLGCLMLHYPVPNSANSLASLNSLKCCEALTQLAESFKRVSAFSRMRRANLPS